MVKAGQGPAEKFAPKAWFIAGSDEPQPVMKLIGIILFAIFILNIIIPINVMNENENNALVPDIREVLAQHGRFPVENLAEGDDLYNAGLTSLATVAVMLALEDKFNVEFPDNLIGRRTFKSIESIAEAITKLAA